MKTKIIAKQKNIPILRFPEFRDAGEWEEKVLGDICHHFKGFAFKSKYYTTSGRRIVRVSDMGFDYIKNETSAIYIKEDEAKLYKKWKLVKDDLIITTVGSKPPVYDSLVGRTIVVKLKDEGSLLNQNAVCLRAKKNIEQRFLNSLFRRNEYISFIESIIRGNANQGSIALVDLFKYKILQPKPKEQQKIANCLSSIDALITAQTQKLDALKAHKKGLMQQLFPTEGETIPKLRFPEFRNVGKWQEIKLINSADKKVKWSFIGGPFGSNLKSSDYVNDGIRIIQLQNIGDAEFINNYKIFTSKEKADELLSNNIYPSDIIISKMGDPVGRACLIPDDHPRYVMCSDGIRLVVDEKRFSKYFIYTLINSTPFRNLVEETATGSTRKRIGLADLKKLPMIVPKQLEQQKIANCLSSIDNLIIAQAKKIEALKTHKKGLMQQLFPTTDEEV